MNEPERNNDVDRSQEIFYSIRMASDTPPELQKTLAKMEYRYATIGCVASMACILVGAVLVCAGAFGSTAWTARIIGAQFSDVPPGVLLMIIGFLILRATRPDVRHIPGASDTKDHAE